MRRCPAIRRRTHSVRPWNSRLESAIGCSFGKLTRTPQHAVASLTPVTLACAAMVSTSATLHVYSCIVAFEDRRSVWESPFKAEPRQPID